MSASWPSYGPSQFFIIAFKNIQALLASGPPRLPRPRTPVASPVSAPRTPGPTRPASAPSPPAGRPLRCLRVLPTCVMQLSVRTSSSLTSPRESARARHSLPFSGFILLPALTTLCLSDICSSSRSERKFFESRNIVRFYTRRHLRDLERSA